VQIIRCGEQDTFFRIVARGHRSHNRRRQEERRRERRQGSERAGQPAHPALTVWCFLCSSSLFLFPLFLS
jgi:hypothetical protein